MSYFLLTLFALVVTAAVIGGIWVYASKQRQLLTKNTERRRQELEAKKTFCNQIRESLSEMIPAQSLQERFVELQVLDEALRAERGRITITEAEMETVEVRLRELEEIERELEASSIETKEEMRILQKKSAELRKSLEDLKATIEQCASALDSTLAEDGQAGAFEERLIEIRSALQATLEQGEKVLVELEKGNQQYFAMKSRYDALDIEYAQLYEKFSVETATQEKEKK
jgi:chromosome segregation ATPase